MLKMILWENPNKDLYTEYQLRMIKDDHTVLGHINLVIRHLGQREVAVVLYGDLIQNFPAYYISFTQIYQNYIHTHKNLSTQQAVELLKTYALIHSEVRPT